MEIHAPSRFGSSMEPPMFVVNDTIDSGTLISANDSKKGISFFDKVFSLCKDWQEINATGRIVGRFFVSKVVDWFWCSSR